MPLVKLNARDTIVEVSDGQSTPTWTEVAGITGITINPSENEEVAATNDFHSAGQYDEEVMQRGATLTITGQQLIDLDTGAPDPGQQAVEILAAAVGYDSRGTIRFRNAFTDTWKVWACTARLSEQGGETNAKSTWGATIRKCGPSSTAPVEVGP